MRYAGIDIGSRTIELDQFGREALKSKKDIQISNMCTVFAESEVTSLVAGGNPVKILLWGCTILRYVGRLEC